MTGPFSRADQTRASHTETTRPDGRPHLPLVAFAHDLARGTLALTGRVAGAVPGLRGAQARLRHRPAARVRRQHGQGLAGAQAGRLPGAAAARAAWTGPDGRAAAVEPGAGPVADRGHPGRARGGRPLADQA